MKASQARIIARQAIFEQIQHMHVLPAITLTFEEIAERDGYGYHPEDGDHVMVLEYVKEEVERVKEFLEVDDE